MCPALRGHLMARGATWEDAEDVLSIVWERAWRHLAVIQDPAWLWLRRVARNVLIDRYRRSRTRVVATLTLPDDATESGEAEDGGPGYASPRAMIDPAPGPEAVVVEEDEARRVLTLLPADDRAVLVLAAEGRTYREIARRLGVPKSTVTMRLHRSRGRLRRLPHVAA